MTTLIIARHGNTFAAGETPRRVGARTDIPLVDSGREQARKIGAWLKEQGMTPEITYSSRLKRTIETAEIALKTLGAAQPVFPLEIFDEIDYGPDENKTEEEVIARLGAEPLKDWDEKGIVPQLWRFDPDEAIRNWKNFAAHIVEDEQSCVMVVTSNGIARFAPHITGDFETFRKDRKIKIATGAVCVFEHNGTEWQVREWNVRP